MTERWLAGAGTARRREGGWGGSAAGKEMPRRKKDICAGPNGAGVAVQDMSRARRRGSVKRGGGGAWGRAGCAVVPQESRKRENRLEFTQSLMTAAFHAHAAARHDPLSAVQPVPVHAAEGVVARGAHRKLGRWCRMRSPTAAPATTAPPARPPTRTPLPTQTPSAPCSPSRCIQLRGSSRAARTASRVAGAECAPRRRRPQRRRPQPDPPRTRRRSHRPPQRRAAPPGACS